MTRTRGPPRRPSRDRGAGRGMGGIPAPDYPGRETRSREYRPIAAQQASTTSGGGNLRYPPTSAAPLPSINPNAAPAGLTSSNTNNIRMEELPDNTLHPTSDQPGPEIIGDETAALAEYPYSIYNHGTWTADDDRTLIQARTRGQNWADLQRTHFPSKTANACRKRYERLVERRGIHDYSGRRLELVANEYMNMRREIWSPLADRLGMKWEVVEALCMGAGLRTIQSNARSYTNRARRDNRISQKTREAQADAAAVGLASGALPVGSEFGTAFTGQSDRAPPTGDRSDTSLMPPPPYIPAGSQVHSTRLPPMIPPPQVPFTGYRNEASRSVAGPSRMGAVTEPPMPGGRPPDWHGANVRGPQ